MAPQTPVGAAHRRVVRSVLLGLICAGGLSIAQPVRADVDMTGHFVGFAYVFIPSSGCTFDFVQTGTSLSITGDCEPYFGPLTMTGTIDPMTGSFSASGSASPLQCSVPGSLTITATAAPDSSQFSGTIQCGPNDSGFVEGFRCGNNQLDPGEACDLGLFVNGTPRLVLLGGVPVRADDRAVPCWQLSAIRPSSAPDASDSCPADVHDADNTPCTENQGCLERHVQQRHVRRQPAARGDHVWLADAVFARGVRRRRDSVVP